MFPPSFWQRQAPARLAIHEVTSQQDQNKNQLPVTSGLCPEPLLYPMFRLLISVRIRPDDRKPKHTKPKWSSIFFLDSFHCLHFLDFVEFLYSVQSVKKQNYQLYTFDNIDTVSILSSNKILS